MAEYISREAVEQVLCGIANGLSVGETEALKTKDVRALYKIKGAKEILNAVDNDLSFIPSVEVQPVKHGKWIWIKNYRDCEGDIYSQYKCSCCDFCVGGVYSLKDLTHFCGECGVKMDLENGDINE